MTVWFSNNRVETSVVTVSSRDFIVCKRIVGSHAIVFVEDIRTGKRAFPDTDNAGFDLAQSEKIARELIQQLIEE
ncbi:hypothetical protein M5J14_21200 [Lysinibacillus sp. OL1_EC]|uniref:hypothetical protein n=1 Tax=unclassified Lysinibacillus TaxID=2636778 RepID=UPI00103D3D57|nr:MULTISPECIES: hypothetical protein [unclassified Lysinibacillus]MCM0627020.1 hypothetical protein [Lysinibacillus sp. OL1_EC]TBV85123.1 hypothetical protein EW028_22625 [Lysinibacillus sp. OL1]